MAEHIPLLTAEEWQRAPFGQWVAHSGTISASRQLALWLAGGGNLWLSSSERQCGKSHLLNELVASSPQCALIRLPEISGVTATERVVHALKALNEKPYWLVDLDAGACDPISGEALFHLIECARGQGSHLLISWYCKDAQLAPPELASRLRTFDKATLLPPANDEELRSILLSVAHNLHWDVPDAIIRVMLTHTERTLARQLDVLRQLEQESRPGRIRPTQRWAREHLERNKQDLGNPQ